MKKSVFNNCGIESVISFINNIFSPFQRIVTSVFIVLSPLISILAGPVRLIGIDRTIENGSGSRIKK